MSRTRRILSVTVLTAVFVLTGCSTDRASASNDGSVTAVTATSSNGSDRGDIRVTR